MTGQFQQHLIQATTDERLRAAARHRIAAQVEVPRGRRLSRRVWAPLARRLPVRMVVAK
jgi:hypothetical protein